VIPISEETLARFGDDGVDRMSRQLTARRDMDRDDFHRTTFTKRSLG
jgi:hypothetical protein